LFAKRKHDVVARIRYTQNTIDSHNHMLTYCI